MAYHEQPHLEAPDETTLSLPACRTEVNLECYPHYHSKMEMVFCYEGELHVVIGGKSLTLQENQLLLVPCYLVHRYWTPESSRVSVLTAPMDALPHGEELAEATFSSQVIKNCAAMEEILFYFSQLADESAFLHPYRKLGYLYALAGLVLEQVTLEARPDREGKGQLQDILQYLNANFLKPLTLDNISAHFGYSKSRFSHIFNENVGCSITEYLGFLRAREAAQLLEQEELSISIIAEQGGFGSTRSFYRTFQRCYDITPNEFRGLSPQEKKMLLGQHPLPIEL